MSDDSTVVIHANDGRDDVPSIQVTESGRVRVDSTEWPLTMSVEEAEETTEHLLQATAYIRNGRATPGPSRPDPWARVDDPSRMAFRRSTPQEPASAPQEPAGEPQAGSWGVGPNVDPLTDQDDSFTNAVVVAIGEFASSLAGSYPECPTGDIAPDVDETFFKAAMRFAEEWVKANHPTHQPRPFTVVGQCHTGIYPITWIQPVMSPNAVNAYGEALQVGDRAVDDHRCIAVFPGHISPEA